MLGLLLPNRGVGPRRVREVGAARSFQRLSPFSSLNPPDFSLRPEGVFVPEEGSPDFLPSASSFWRFASLSFSSRSRSSSESV